MSPLLIKLINWLNSIVDQRLIEVIALVHVFKEHEDINSPQAIYLVIENNMSGSIECESDGESIAYNPEIPAEVDLGEHGKTVLKNISNTGSWSKCVGNILDSSFLLLADNDVCIGARLLFQSGNSIDIVNLGDELCIYDSLPKNIIEEERIVIKKVTPDMI